MPRSRSRSIESITRSLTSWFSRKAPDCHSIASTRVVFPWSTWATMATLRRSSRRGMRPVRVEASAAPAGFVEHRPDRTEQLVGAERLLHERRGAVAPGVLDHMVLGVAGDEHDGQPGPALAQ